MIQLERLRLFHDKLISIVEAIYDKQTGCFHLTSSATPEANDRLIPLAENGCLALLLCKTKTQENIQKARKILQTIVHLQHASGLFYRYLHEVAFSPCYHSTARLELVFKALLKWHVLALGDLAPLIEKSLKQIQSIPSKAHALSIDDEIGVLQEKMMWTLLSDHIDQRALSSKCFNFFTQVTTAWNSLNLIELEHCPIEVGANKSWADLIFWLYGGAEPNKIELSHMWCTLLHAYPQDPLAQLVPEKGPQDSHLAFHTTYRNLPACVQRRSINRSVFWQFVQNIKEEKHTVALQFLSDVADVRIIQIDTMSWQIDLQYEPLANTGFDEDRPLFLARLNKVQPWMIANHIATAYHQKELEEGIKLQLASKVSKSNLLLKVTEKTGCFTHGYWHQHPAQIDSLHELACHYHLYFQSLTPTQAGFMRLQVAFHNL